MHLYQSSNLLWNSRPCIVQTGC